jgi:hypothetical protein
MAHEAVALSGISELRGALRTNRTPVYFIAPTAFNLLGVDRWCRDFYYVNYYDSFDGGHPRVIVPPQIAHEEFGSIEDVCNYLLAHPALRARIAARGHNGSDARYGKAVFLFFDEQSERLAHEAGLEVALPSAELRNRLDSKIVTTQLGDQAGVPSVPNVLGRAAGYTELLALADRRGLGDDLVVQTPYGDSGKTTFFIRGERDWNTAAEELVGEELKVMRRIEPRAIAIEACITRHGTVIGPLMTELTGHPELTPYRGGWCGNEIFPRALSPANRQLALRYTRQLGDRIAQEGYRGQMEIDFLVDASTDQLYLGELNPRITGISSLTNADASAYADLPLFLFHLIEYLDVDYELDVGDLNRRWGSEHLSDVWGQIILKEPDDRVELLTAAPRTGIWCLDGEGNIDGPRRANDWHSLGDESEGFYLRILGPGDYRYRGADLGILVTRARLQTDDGQLTERCRQWINGIRSQFAGQPLTPDHDPPVLNALAFKNA